MDGNERVTDLLLDVSVGDRVVCSGVLPGELAPTLFLARLWLWWSSAPLTIMLRVTLLSGVSHRWRGSKRRVAYMSSPPEAGGEIRERTDRFVLPSACGLGAYIEYRHLDECSLMGTRGA